MNLLQLIGFVREQTRIEEVLSMRLKELSAANRAEFADSGRHRVEKINSNIRSCLKIVEIVFRLV